MSGLSKPALYFNTIKYMKPGQIACRLRKMAGLKCSLGCRVRKFEPAEICPCPALKELDYDRDFLSRFSADGILGDHVSFLHRERAFRWDEKWDCPDQSALWNFNLHYFEYLFPLADAYQTTGDRRYLDKSKQCITSWIRQNPKETGGSGWTSYTIALRLTVWLDYYAEMEEEIRQAPSFRREFLKSVYEQYVFLSNHLEKDLLGNHYFEDLKTLVLCALFFRDDKYLQCVLREFKVQCKEQILEDGMHFELSPMYHKIILEDMLRVAWALRNAGKQDEEVEGYLQPMLDVAYSLEEGLERVPLFNDGGNNVAKSLDALMQTAEKYFHIAPVYKSRFPASGYYIFKQGGWKLIVDAGQPGPTYIPGHAHCDAMSFELFRDGKPVIVNCGTYAYQCEEREFFRSTAAHNTVMVDGVEQSQCWGAFRLGKRSYITVLGVSDTDIQIEMRDQCRHIVRREIKVEREKLVILDIACNTMLKAFLHCLDDDMKYQVSGNAGKEYQLYAPDYGYKQEIISVSYETRDQLICEIDLNVNVVFS